jgi:hypothetical protein
MFMQNINIAQIVAIVTRNYVFEPLFHRYISFSIFINIILLGPWEIEQYFLYFSELGKTWVLTKNYDYFQITGAPGQPQDESYFMPPVGRRCADRSGK